MINFRATLDARAVWSQTKEAVPARVVLQGDVVTMVLGAGVVRNGRVCIEGNTIALVTPAETPLPEAFKKAPHVQTDGTIYPGLIDLHNHLTYNHIPMWSVPRRFTNRGRAALRVGDHQAVPPNRRQP